MLDAYGWSTIAVPPYCPENVAEDAAREEFEDEVIDRLYVLNAERAAEETRLGLNKKTANKRTRKKTASKTSKTIGTTMSLPGMSDDEGTT